MPEQQTIISSGNEAAAHAIIDIGYDGEGYYPITPSSEVGEYVNRAYAQGEIDLSFVVGTCELAAISIVAGMAIAGGRAVDVTSSQGLLLKAEELPAMAGLGLPVILNLATRDVNAPAEHQERPLRPGRHARLGLDHLLRSHRAGRLRPEYHRPQGGRGRGPAGAHRLRRLPYQPRQPPHPSLRGPPDSARPSWVRSRPSGSRSWTSITPTPSGRT